MFLLFCVLFVFMVKADPYYVCMGLTSRFNTAGGTARECNNTKDCHDDICTILQNNPFAMMTTLSDSNDPFKKMHFPVNMIVFGIGPNNRTILKHSALICYSFFECLNFGVNIQEPKWIVFAGQCR